MDTTDFLLISLCATSLTLALVFLTAWYRFGKLPHLLTWSLTFGFSTLQWLGNIFGDMLFPSLEIYRLVVNLLSILVVSSAVHGFRQWGGETTLSRKLIIAALLATTIVFLSVFAETERGFQMAVNPIYSGILLLWVIIIVYSVRKPGIGEVTDWALLVATGLLALQQLGAGVAAVMYGLTSIESYLSMYSLINLTGMPASFIAMGMFTILLVASDLFRRLENQATTDQLTGLLNRRGFEADSGAAISQCRRYSMDLSIIVTDIDYFKQINDNYGHGTGDLALREFAKSLRNMTRLEDIVCRLGGEEFAIVLPNTCLQEAMMTALRMKEKIAQTVLETESGAMISMTASFGVTQLQPEDQNIEDIIHRADRALYRAKESGRDRVESA